MQGRGLLLGLRLTRPAGEIQTALLAHHILSGTSSDPQVLRLMPLLRSRAPRPIRSCRRWRRFFNMPTTTPHPDQARDQARAAHPRSATF